jgi:hypothetical protein
MLFEKATSYAIRRVGRDPFARHDIIRRQVPITQGGCDFCGNKSAKGRLYEYGTEPDDNPSRRGFYAGKFCSRALQILTTSRGNQQSRGTERGGSVLH